MTRPIRLPRLLHSLTASTIAIMLAMSPALASDSDPAVDGEAQHSSSGANNTDSSEAKRRWIDTSNWGAPTANYDDRVMGYTLFGRPGRVTARGTAKPRYRENFSLGEDDDDEWKLNLSLTLRNEFDVTDWMKTMVSMKFLQNADLAVEDGETESDGSVQRGLAWVYFHNLADTGLGLQVGRQKFKDKREWWWDERLDSIRAEWVGERFRIEAAIAEEQGKVALDEDHSDAEDDDILRVLVHAEWNWAERQHLHLFFLSHDDHSSAPIPGQLLAPHQEDEDDADLRWIGIRSTGRYKVNSDHRVYYWLDAAYVWGEETMIDYDPVAGRPDLIRIDEIIEQDVEAWAVDVGTTWETKWRAEPRFTFGYAIGSGDSDPREDVNGNNSQNFRQTGLQDNNTKWRGENKFRYYGELMRPELSNLHITTFAVGFPVLESSSIELIHHYYRQVHEAEFLRDARVNESTTGDDPDIGHEFDVSLGLEEWEYFKAELTTGLFRAGDAYGDDEGELAFNFSLSLKVEF